MSGSCQEQEQEEGVYKSKVAEAIWLFMHVCVPCVKHASRIESIIVASMFRHLLLRYRTCTYMFTYAVLIFCNTCAMFCFDTI